MIGYYRKCIKDFAKITKPLTKCLKKDAKIIHDAEFKCCFETCKNLLENEPILQYPDFNKDFILTTDASNIALGAILSQGTVGRDRPVSYASRTLNESEQNYSTIEKELLAIVWATKYFRPYLYGRKFKIITDHKPLKWLMNLKEPNSRLVRWRLKLEEFDYEIEYKRGVANSNADALSRVEINSKEIFEYMENFNKALSEDPRDNDENESLIVNLDDNNDDREGTDDLTVHTSREEPILGMTITEKCVNSYDHQIIIDFVLHSAAKPKIEQIFKSKNDYMFKLH